MSYSRSLALLAAAGTLSCTSPSTARGQQATPAAAADTVLLSADTVLLSAVVRAVRAEVGSGRLLADPRPLLEVLYTTETSFVRVSPAVLRAREAALRNLGVELADAVRLGQNASCRGIWVMVPPDSQKAHPDPHAGCPKEPVYVVAIGLPRPGRERLAAGAIYGPNGAAEGYWAVRVIGTDLGPGGSSVTGSDYLMKKEGTGWRFIEAAHLFSAH